MMNLRASIKDVFYRIKMVNVLDLVLFNISYLKNRRKNLIFRNKNPGLIIPPDYFLYETYKLDYEQFITDGECTAKEIIDWTNKYSHQKFKRILDWGCGVSRVVTHIKKITDSSTLLFGCDINKQMIAFNKQNFRNITFDLVSYNPPTLYEDDYFDLIYGLSIFTHIEATMQEQWLIEIFRILNNNGIFLLTTHGKYFYSKLLHKEKRLLNLHGSYSKSFSKNGHRMMTTYNSPAIFRVLLEKYFDILEFHDGDIDQTKAGGQDLWIVKKRNPIEISRLLIKV